MFFCLRGGGRVWGIRRFRLGGLGFGGNYGLYFVCRL